MDAILAELLLGKSNYDLREDIHAALERAGLHAHIRDDGGLEPYTLSLTRDLDGHEPMTQVIWVLPVWKNDHRIIESPGEAMRVLTDELAKAVPLVVDILAARRA